jgi:hypothetical protein
MQYNFAFTSTQRDLLDAFEAYRRQRTGMRSWARGLFALLGLMWLAGAIAVLVTGLQPEAWWQAPAWLILGVMLSWSFLVRPFMVRRRIRASNSSSQNVSLMFNDARIEIELDGVGRHWRPWTELLLVVRATKGIGLGFHDGTFNWIPRRAFDGTDQRKSFEQFLSGKTASSTDPEAV